MSRFVDPNDLHQIDLGKGDWIKVPKRISYGMIASLNDVNSSTSETTTKMLVALIREWNLKNDAGVKLPVNKENIMMLDVPTVTKVSEYLGTIMDVDKKKAIG